MSDKVFLKHMYFSGILGEGKGQDFKLWNNLEIFCPGKGYKGQSMFQRRLSSLCWRKITKKLFLLTLFSPLHNSRRTKD